MKKKIKVKKKKKMNENETIEYQKDRIKKLVNIINEKSSEILELNRDLDGARHVISKLVNETIYKGRTFGPKLTANMKINDLGLPPMPFGI